MKKILAPLTGDQTDRSVLDAAYVLALSTNAHIHAVFMRRDPMDAVVSTASVGMAGGMAGGVLDSLLEAENEQAEIARNTAQAHYDVWRQENGVQEESSPGLQKDVTVEKSEAMGRHRSNLAKLGCLVDVICVLHSTDNDSFDKITLMETALMETSCAVLLAPNTIELEAIKSVAIAWNDSLEARRSVTLAMPVLLAAETITVISGIGDNVSLEDVTAFVESLKWYGINADTKVFTADSDGLTERLQSEALSAGAQLLILGAYSHSRLREFVMGGVTDDILKLGRMPVLIAH